MKKCTLVIKDFVNVKFENLDLVIRNKINKTLKYMPAYARHTPQYKLKRWDGMIPFATVGGGTYLNLLDRVLPMILEAGYEIDIQDLRPNKQFDFPEIDEYFLSEYTWAKGHIYEGEPIILMDHQVNAVNAYLKNPQSLECLATSSGKTIITACLSKIVEKNKGRSLIIVPSIQLVRQTEEDYLNLGLDTGVYFGEEKNYDNQHIITTWQSMMFLTRDAKENPESKEKLNRILKNLDCVIVDEAHGIKGSELKFMLCETLSKIPLRWGLTGTIPKDEYDFICLLVAIGNVVHTVYAKELQDLGLISNCHVTIVRTIDDHVEFTDYESEKDFLHSDKERIAWFLEYCKEVIKTGNTLVLVGNIDLGKKLSKLVPNSFFIYGNVKNDKRIEEFKKMAQNDNVILFATFQTCSTGISAVRIFNLILLESGRSFTRVIQSAGRVLRKGGDKDFANIYDICSTLKYSSKHLSVRKTYYKEAQYKFTENKINYKTT
jgi:superfamily II DNA or RNA helicase